MSNLYKNDILRYTRLGRRPSEIRAKIGHQLSRQRIKQIQDDLMKEDEQLRNQYNTALKNRLEQVRTSHVNQLRQLAQTGCTISDASKKINKAISYIRKLAVEENITFSKSKINDLYKPGDIVYYWKILEPSHDEEVYSSGKVAKVKKYQAKCLMCGDIHTVLQKNLKLGKSRRCHKCSVTLR